MNMDNIGRFADSMEKMPIIAILRGVLPDEVISVAQAVVDAGIRIVEVPLNSPDPFDSIGRLVKHFGNDAIIGAGTVLRVDDVAKCGQVGAQIIVSPNMDVAVIRATVAGGMISAPGCLTPTESFAALNAGAHAVKLFPGELLTPGTVKAMRAVLPKEANVMVVGGVTVENMTSFRAAGATGFGIGGSIYRAGDAAADAGRRAAAFVAAMQL